MSEVRMPEVLSRTIADGSVNYSLSIPGDLIWFAGHFPQLPILPGVVQIDWVMHFIKDLQLTGHFDGVSRMKFTRPIQPGARLQLRLSARAGGSSVNYRYYDDEGSYSSGNILLRV